MVGEGDRADSVRECVSEVELDSETLAEGHDLVTESEAETVEEEDAECAADAALKDADREGVTAEDAETERSPDAVPDVRVAV
jgi:hypothetical protein